MLIVKYIFLFFILMGSSLIGILISKKYKNRVEELNSFKEAFNILEAKIKFTYEPLKDIFEEISNILPKNNLIPEVFKCTSLNMSDKDFQSSWEYALDNTELNINSEDKNIIKGLGNMLREDRYTRTTK